MRKRDIPASVTRHAYAFSGGFLHVGFEIALGFSLCFTSWDGHATVCLRSRQCLLLFVGHREDVIYST